VDISKNEILEFLNMKSALKSCNSCGNDASDFSYLVGKITAWDSHETDESNYEIITVECNHCANIQLFSADSISNVVQKYLYGEQHD